MIYNADEKAVLPQPAPGEKRVGPSGSTEGSTSQVTTPDKGKVPAAPSRQSRIVSINGKLQIVQD